MSKYKSTVSLYFKSKEDADEVYSSLRIGDAMSLVDFDIDKEFSELESQLQTERELRRQAEEAIKIWKKEEITNKEIETKYIKELAQRDKTITTLREALEFTIASWEKGDDIVGGIDKAREALKEAFGEEHESRC